MARTWSAVVGLVLASIPLGWWLFAFGRRWRKVERFGPPALAFGVYVPVLVAVPFLRQPRAGGRPLRVAGVLLVAGAAVIRALALREFRRRGARLAPEGWTPPVLVQTGIYRIVRHPMYLSDWLLFAGWCCCWRALYGLGLVAPPLLAAAWSRAWLEDRHLHEPAFGAAFREYRRSTGTLVPRLRLPAQDARASRWKR